MSETKDTINGVKYATPANMREVASNEGEVIAARGVFAYCRGCGSKVSASAGDYFMMDDDMALRCCGVKMILAREHSNIMAI